MRAAVLSACMLLGCYERSSVVPCTVSCTDAPCPDDLVCGTDFLCQLPGEPLCTGEDSRTAYVKAPNADAGDEFGTSVALSDDGEWLVVGAPGEASNARDLDGSQTDNSLAGAGAAYVFHRDGARYVLETYVKSPQPDAGDRFGASVALSADGKVLAIGAPFEDGNGINVGGDPADNGTADSGAVFVYERAQTTDPFVRTQYVKPSTSVANTQFGSSVSLSEDGARLAIGAQGVGHNPILARFSPSFTGIGGQPPGSEDGDHVGSVIAVSRDGQTMLVGAELEDGPGTGFTGDPAANTALDAGAVYVFPFATAQHPYCKASNTEAGDQFGISVAVGLAADRFAVGANHEDSAASQTDNSATDAGAVYIFERTGLASWVQPTFLKAPNSGAGDNFGQSLALVADGSLLVVGAPGEASGNGDPLDDSAPRAGAAYLFEDVAGTWQLRSYLKAANADAGDELGASVAVSDDRTTIAAGAPHEASAAADNPDDNSGADAGAVYVFR